MFSLQKTPWDEDTFFFVAWEMSAKEAHTRAGAGAGSGIGTMDQPGWLDEFGTRVARETDSTTPFSAAVEHHVGTREHGRT